MHSVWSFNDAVFFKKSDSTDELGQKIEHIEDIEYYIFQLKNFE